MENKSTSTSQLNNITNKLKTEVNQIQQGVTPPSSKSVMQKMAQAGVKPKQENYATAYSGVRYTDTYQMDSAGRRNRVYGDEYDYSKSQQENIENIASKQSTEEKWANGLTKFLGKTGTAVIGGTIGTVNGLTEFVTSGNFSSIYDNSFNKRLEDLNAKMDYKLPNYYTQAERDKSLFAQMGTANFWANDVLGGLSFTAGAIVSEGLWSLATGGTSLATTATRLGAQMSAKGGMKALLKNTLGKKALTNGANVLNAGGVNIATATNLGKLASFGNTARFTMTSAGYESSVEAMHYQKEMRDNFLLDFEAKNGRQPTMEERTAFEKKLTDGANAVFGFNMALVGSSNIAVMGKIYDLKMPSFGISQALNKKLFGVGVDASGKAVLQANRAQKIAGSVFSLTKPMVVEGVWEEGGQSVVGKAFQNYVKASYDPKYTNQSLELSEAFMEGMEETFTTKEGFKEVLIGMIIGGVIGKGSNLVSGRGFSELKGAEELAKSQVAFNTSFSAEQIAENAMITGRPKTESSTNQTTPSATGQESLERFLNGNQSSTTSTTLSQNLVYANRTQGATEIEETTGDFVESQMAKEQGVISQLAMANNLDQYDDTVEDTVIALEAMEVETIAKQHDISIEEATEYKEQLITEYKQTALEYKQNRDFVEYYLGDNIKNISNTSAVVLKDALAYIMTAGKNSYRTSENLLNSIKNDLKNITGVQGSADVIATLSRLNSDGKVQLALKSKALQDTVQQLEEKEAQLAEQQKNQDTEQGATNLNTLTVEIAELNKAINKLQQEANDIIATSQVFKNDTMTGKTSLTREELTDLNASMNNLESVVANLETTDPVKGRELRDKLEAFKKSTEAFQQFAEVNKAITDSTINLSKRKSLIDKIIRSSKISEKELEFLSTIANRIEESKDHAHVLKAIKERIKEQKQALKDEDPTITEEEVVARTAYESLVLNNPYLQGRFTEEELAQALESAEARERFTELVEQAKAGANPNTPLQELYDSPTLTEEESTELRELVSLLSTLEVAQGFSNEGITLQEILEQAIQLRTADNLDTSQEQVTSDTFAEMTTEEQLGEVSSNNENISNTALNVQVSERNGSVFIHNFSLKGFLKGLNYTVVESIEEDGTATPLADTAIDEQATPKLRLTLANGDVITVEVTGNRSLKINNRLGKYTIDIIHNNSNYRRIKYTKGKGHAYSFLFENGQMLDSDFTITDRYNYEAIYDLQQGEELFFEVDMNDPYNQMLRDTNDPNAEQKVKIYITNAKGDVVGEVKATDSAGMNSDNFHLLRLEAFEVFKKGGGVLKYQADVVKVLLGTPKLQVDIDGVPTTVDFGTEQVVDQGYYHNGKLKLKNGTADVNVDFLHKLKNAPNVPIVVFKRGNQVVAIPVSLITEPSMQGQVFTEFLEQNNDNVAKTIIEINKTLLENNIKTPLYFKSPQDQNIFNEDGSFTEVFKNTMEVLDQAPAKPDLLNTEKSDLKNVIQSMVDFDSNPIVSPKIIFNLGAMYEGRAESIVAERSEEATEEEVTQAVGEQTQQTLEELNQNTETSLYRLEKLSEFLVRFTREGIKGIEARTNALLTAFNDKHHTDYTTITEVAKDRRVTEEEITEIEEISEDIDFYTNESEALEREILELENQLGVKRPKEVSKNTKTKELPKGKKVIKISENRFVVVDDSVATQWEKLKDDKSKSRFLGTYGVKNKDNTKIQKGDYAEVEGVTYEVVGNNFGKPMVSINGKNVVALNSIKGNEKIVQQMLENKQKVVTLHSEGRTEREAIDNFSPKDSPNLLPPNQRKEWDSSRGDRFLPNSAKDVRGADPELTYLAEEYARRNGIDYKRQSEYVKVDPERAKRIAEAYEQMEHNPQDPVVKEAFQNLITQTKAQYDILVEAGYTFYFFDETNDPYDGNPARAMRDLTENKTMGVFSTQSGFGSNETLDVSDNPMLEDTGLTWGFGSLNGEQRPVLANDLFRAVHDAFGHGIEGTGFRARGEENAWQAHARLFTGSAVAAITSETRGQNSWLNYGKHGEHNRTAPVEETIFADQKTGLMPEWTWQEGFDTGEAVEEVQEAPTQTENVTPVKESKAKKEKKETSKPKEEKKVNPKPAPEANLTRNTQFMNESNAVHFEKTASYSLVGRNQPPIITTDAIANGSPIFNTISPSKIKTIKLLSFNKDTNKGEIQIKTVDNDMHIAFVEFKQVKPKATETTKTATVENPQGSQKTVEVLKYGITLNEREDFVEIRVPAYKNDDSDMDLDDFTHGQLLKDGDRLHVPNEVRPLMRKKGRIFYGDLAKEAYVRQGNPEFKQGVLIVRNKDSKFSMKQFDSLRIDQDLANNADSNSKVC